MLILNGDREKDRFVVRDLGYNISKKSTDLMVPGLLKECMRSLLNLVAVFVPNGLVVEVVTKNPRCLDSL